MRIAFAIVRYFPFGGAQRDCLTFARMLAARGHDITIFTTEWRGQRPADVSVEEIPVRAYSNHVRNMRFSRALATRIQQQRFDGVVG
ncbi:MAG: glycosyltransferase, partial [Fimbriimonadaceae bacterium]|nr:glycosyltransferase [Alphaproteobacteria bacterium]